MQGREKKGEGVNPADRSLSSHPDIDVLIAQAKLSIDTTLNELRDPFKKAVDSTQNPSLCLAFNTLFDDILELFDHVRQPERASSAENRVTVECDQITVQFEQLKATLPIDLPESNKKMLLSFTDLCRDLAIQRILLNAISLETALTKILTPLISATNILFIKHIECLDNDLKKRFTNRLTVPPAFNTYSDSHYTVKRAFNLQIADQIKCGTQLEPTLEENEGHIFAAVRDKIAPIIEAVNHFLHSPLPALKPQIMAYLANKKKLTESLATLNTEAQLSLDEKQRVIDNAYAALQQTYDDLQVSLKPSEVEQQLDRAKKELTARIKAAKKSLSVPLNLSILPLKKTDLETSKFHDIKKIEKELKEKKRLLNKAIHIINTDLKKMEDLKFKPAAFDSEIRQQFIELNMIAQFEKLKTAFKAVQGTCDEQCYYVARLYNSEMHQQWMKAKQSIQLNQHQIETAFTHIQEKLTIDYFEDMAEGIIVPQFESLIDMQTLANLLDYKITSLNKLKINVEAEYAQQIDALVLNLQAVAASSIKQIAELEAARYKRAQETAHFRAERELESAEKKLRTKTNARAKKKVIKLQQLLGARPITPFLAEVSPTAQPSLPTESPRVVPEQPLPSDGVCDQSLPPDVALPGIKRTTIHRPARPTLAKNSMLIPPKKRKTIHAKKRGKILGTLIGIGSGLLIGAGIGALVGFVFLPLTFGISLGAGILIGGLIGGGACAAAILLGGAGFGVGYVADRKTKNKTVDEWIQAEYSKDLQSQRASDSSRSPSMTRENPTAPLSRPVSNDLKRSFSDLHAQFKPTFFSQAPLSTSPAPVNDVILPHAEDQPPVQQTNSEPDEPSDKKPDKGKEREYSPAFTRSNSIYIKKEPVTLFTPPTSGSLSDLMTQVSGSSSANSPCVKSLPDIEEMKGYEKYQMLMPQTDRKSESFRRI